MYFDANGRPAADGAFEIIDGKLRPRRTMRDGEYIGTSVMLMDGRSGAATPSKSAARAALDQRLARLETAYLGDADRTAATAPATVAEARRQWLRDRETAYRGGR